MLKSSLLALALVASASTFAVAQDTTIIKEKERPAIAVPVPVPLGPSHDTVIERRNTETTGRGNCESKTVTHDDIAGSKSVTRERCN
jgi:hypothetical protein